MSEFYFFTPYDDRGLGFAYNKCCAIVPNDDDWIGLMDSDVMLFPSHWGTLIREAVEKCPSVLSMITCRATRIYRNSRQQYSNAALRGCSDLVQLHSEAVKVAKRPFFISEMSGPVSGFFMLFQKRLWRDAPFPEVGSAGHRLLGIDTEWIRRLRAAGKRIGLMENLLAVHYYRLHSGDKDKSHLE